ncbi:MAG TPA: hypothetical protein PLT28_11730, partial [Saprospiraceae bacterium]|nr:hypothetical protein [Saprospiraceae bacterium]
MQWQRPGQLGIWSDKEGDFQPGTTTESRTKVTGWQEVDCSRSFSHPNNTSPVMASGMSRPMSMSRVGARSPSLPGFRWVL